MLSIRQLAGAAALVAFVALGYAAISVAFKGTGEELPTGPNTLVGRIRAADEPGTGNQRATGNEPATENELVRSPAGEPFVFGDVRITTPGASRVVDHAWWTAAGNARVTLETSHGVRRLELPLPREWKGITPRDQREVQMLDGLPIVGDVTDVTDRLPPPYLVVVRALRPGDSVTAKVRGETATELWVGSPEQLHAHLRQHEAMRWPIVGLMGLMAVFSLVLGLLGLGIVGRKRKSRAP